METAKNVLAYLILAAFAAGVSVLSIFTVGWQAPAIVGGVSVVAWALVRVLTR